MNFTIRTLFPEAPNPKVEILIPMSSRDWSILENSEQWKALVELVDSLETTENHECH